MTRTEKIRKRRYVIIFILLVVLVTAAIGIYLVDKSPKTIISENLRNNAGVTLVSSNKLPKGYTIEQQPSYISDKKIIVTRFKSKNGAQITLSQQKKPKNVDLKQIDAKENFLVDVGSVYVLKGEKEKLQSIIEPEDSWIYVNADQNIGKKAYKEFIKKLSV